MVSSDEDPASSDKEYSADEEVESSDENEEEQHVVRKAKKPKPPTHWPVDKMTVKQIDGDGMPKEKKAKNRMRRLAGLIARHEIALTRQFKSLDRTEKDMLFTSYIEPSLEFAGKAMRELGKKAAMKLIAKSFRNYKTRLVSDYMSKGLEPFQRYKHIRPADWAEFVKLRSTKESKSKSAHFKCIRSKFTLPHNLGTGRYDGKISQWKKEDEKLRSECIPNPWDEFPDDRSKNFLRARNKLLISEGSAQIAWKNDATKVISENVKEKHEESMGSDVTWIREKDILSACLGSEYPGHVRGVSSYSGWKHGWPEHIDIYKKRRKTAVDYDEVVAKVTQDVTEKLRKEFMAMFVSQGGHTMPFSRTPSPAAGRRSSCTSASEVGGADIVADEDLADSEPDTTELLGGPRSCALIIRFGGAQFEVARGQVYPEQTSLHCSPILDGYVVVYVECVHFPFMEHKLQPPPNDEILYLGQALLQRIQWKRTHILVDPKPMDSEIGRPTASHPQSNKSAHKGTTKSLVMHQKVSANKSATDGEELEQPEKVSSNKAAAAADVEKEVATKADSRSKTAANNESEKEHKLASIAAKITKKTVSKRQPMKKISNISSVWTQEHPKYKYGQPMLPTIELDSAGPSCVALHRYYMQACENKKNDIVVKFKHSHFLRSSNNEVLIVSFGDLYDLFNLDAMDTSLLHCFSLCMIHKIQRVRLVPVGILDPQMMSHVVMETDKSASVDYLAHALSKYAMRDYIMFFHNPGNHWILVLIVPKWNKVLYFDSLRSVGRNLSLLRGVIDEAYEKSNMKQKSTRKLTHASKFACHQQESGNMCGFYAAHHMRIVMSKTNLESSKDFDLTVDHIDNSMMCNIRTEIADFLMSQVIDKNGEFHCSNPIDF